MRIFFIYMKTINYSFFASTNSLIFFLNNKLVVVYTIIQQKRCLRKNNS